MTLLEGAAHAPAPVGPPASALDRLRRRVRGAVLVPGDPGYDAARRVYNGRVDRRPAAVVRCAGVADVREALRVARGEGLPLAVRGGGHSSAGHGVCDGGLVIDLSPLKGARVDPAARTVRAQPGLTWGELDHETQAFGLATTGARISTTGVAGVTLGGGYGWLMRRHGLAVDNLLSVDVVTADGRLVTASAEREPELFWGLRGGGGNFGIVTQLEYRLHPVGPLVTGGMAFHPVARAAEVLRVYAGLMDGAPDDLCALCNQLRLPPAPFVPPHLVGTPVVAVAVCHLGTPEQARRDLDGLRALGAPLIDRIGPMPYLRLQRMYDAAGVFGRLTYGRSGHLRDLDGAAADVLAAHGARVESPFSIVMVSSLGGAVARVGDDETAFGRRRTPFDVAVTAVWEDAAQSDRHVRWVDGAWAELRPRAHGVYVNELGDEGGDRVRQAYTPAAWRRLAALKAAWDPENVFRINQNIPPSA
ncbi:FAD-binding oxidoreductase [Longimicrobium sp.]|uniref:FAD-binding oxidoreductase n=1 Tax=Longimicrobium sp. TaxID=2029185 RepID=UPI002E3539F0|nr:FAD-binding oxidoreductase [Longimicrobium sp.]HEX6036390.1 FAD-binding oxidoreductase [Longimicrobium sp.]